MKLISNLLYLLTLLLLVGLVVSLFEYFAGHPNQCQQDTSKIANDENVQKKQDLMRDFFIDLPAQKFDFLEKRVH